MNLSLKEKYFCNDVGTKTENTPWKMLNINFDFREAKIDNPNNINNLINPIHSKNINQNNQKYF